MHQIFLLNLIQTILHNGHTKTIKFETILYNTYFTATGDFFEDYIKRVIESTFNIMRI